MDVDDSPQDAAFRTQVRAYVQEHLHELVHRGSPPDPDGVQAVEDYRRTQRILHTGGLVGVTWPVEYGGQGGTTMHQVVVNQELTRAGIPPLIGQIGLGMCGPTLITHGTQDQKERFLARLLSAEDVWSQLFSEPGAGSDLAALSTRADRVADGWVVNGQKVWTSGAHYSSWGILLARTNASVAKHRGLTMFVLDMHAPGVTVRPLRQMSGDHAFNEVFLEDVHIPTGMLVGDVDDGWRVALTTLMNERLAIGGAGGDIGFGIEALVELAAAVLPTLSPDRQVLVRQELGQLLAVSLACRWTGQRRLTALVKGETPGPEASAGKVAGTTLGHGIADLGVRLLGQDAVFADVMNATDGRARWQHVQSLLPGLAIAGGATEILKNILGERVLGLPAEPRPDKAAPVPRTAPGAPSATSETPGHSTDVPGHRVPSALVPAGA